MKCKLILITIAAIFLIATSVPALEFGDDITIYDGNSSETAGWHGMQEDDEVEPADQAGQQWDLEGFFLNGSTLTMVGGFDFFNGVSGYPYKSGDIFIDIDGSYTTRTTTDSHRGNETTSDNFGYEYVLDLDFASGAYNIYALNPSSTTLTVYYGENNASDPWRYEDGGTLVGGDVFRYYGFNDLGGDGWLGLSGDRHNALSVDIGFLAGKEFTAHFTIGCGNDNLMGQGTAPVPEPTTILLSGLGLLGMGIFLRRRQKQGWLV